jgi:hypothetical protein
VLSAVNQIGGAAGIAVLGTIFLAVLDSPADGNSRLSVFGNAFAAVIPVEITLYLLAAALMLLLPKAAAAHEA